MRKVIPIVRFGFWFLLGGCVCLISSVTGHSQEVTILLANGGKVTALIETIDSASLSFRTPESTTTARLSYEQIDNIEWPEPDDWTRATQWFELGRYAEALPIFESLAGSKQMKGGFYPAPGNFVTRAQGRLLDCYRRLGDAKGVADHLDAFEPQKMPAGQRELPLALQVWAAAGREDWLDVIDLVAKFSDARSSTSEEGIEIAYLTGLAMEKEGKIRQAILAYAQAYSLNAATDSRLSRLSLKQSINLVAADVERRTALRDERMEEPIDLSELKAQVHLYASIFGDGKLWDDAGKTASDALAEKLTLGEAALGNMGRTEIQGDQTKESAGAEMIEQVTVDGMKKVEIKKEEPEK